MNNEVCIHGNLALACSICSISQKIKPPTALKEPLPTELKVGLANKDQTEMDSVYSKPEIHQEKNMLKTIPTAPKRMIIDEPINISQPEPNALMKERILLNNPQRMDLEGFDKEVELIDLKKHVRRSLI